MMRNTRCPRTSLARHPKRAATSLVLFVATSAALSQPVDGLEEVVVTAQKRTQSLQQTPISITALGAEELEQRSIRNIADLGTLAPNVKISPLPSNTSKATIAIRGSVTSNPAITWEPTVGIYADGIFIGKYSGNVFNIVDLERIEVLRGPQGTLYGKNTMGGAVNLITAPPSGALGGTLRTGLGNHGFLDVYGSIDLPGLSLGTLGSLKAKVALAKQDRDGLYENTATRSEPIPHPLSGDPIAPNPTSSRDHNELDSKVGRLDLLWDISEPMQVRYILDKVNNDNTPAKAQLTHVDPDNDVFGVPFPEELNDYVHAPDRNVGKSPADFDIGEGFKSTSHSLIVEYGLNRLPILGDVTLKYLGNHRELDFRSRLDIDGTPFQLFHAGEQREEYRQQSSEIQITGATESVDYVLGLYHFKEDADVQDPLRPINSFFPGVLLDNSYGFEGSQRAVYGQLEYRPAALDHRLAMTAGLRWTQERKNAYISHPGDFSAEARDSWANLTPTVIAAYDLTDDINVYAKYSEGFKAGGFNGEAETAADFQQGYDPEEVKAFELGLKSRWLDNRLQFNTAVFYNRETDLQLLVFMGGNAAASEVHNAGSSVKSGGEIELVFQPIADLLLTANLGYLDARYREYDEYDPTVGTIVNKKSEKDNPYAPRYTYSLSAQHTLIRGSWGELLTRIDYSYQDDFVAYADRESNRHLKLDGYGLLSARVALTGIPVGDRQTLQLALWGKNLLDEEYRLNGIPFGSHTVSYFGDPRTYGIEAIFTF